MAPCQISGGYSRTTAKLSQPRSGRSATLDPELAPELTITFDVPAAVPEPSTLGLTALGALAILSLRRRQHRKNAASATERTA
jgi:hypothetical protein